MTRVSRGLIGTSNSFGAALRPSDPGVVAARAFENLVKAGASSPLWREKVDWGRILSSGKPDFYGRRLFSEAGKADARYVARVARRAMAGTLPESPRAWGNLRESIKRIYAELAGGSA